MSEPSRFDKEQRQAILRKTVGPLSPGTPVRILAEGDDWVDVTTELPMPQITTFDMVDSRPVISGLRREYIAYRRPRAKTIRKEKW